MHDSNGECPQHIAFFIYINTSNTSPIPTTEATKNQQLQDFLNKESIRKSKKKKKKCICQEEEDTELAA